MKYIIIAVGIVLIVVAIFLIRSWNNFVVLRNRVKDQHSQIDVQLKRRYDLIPNIVEATKGYAEFEKSTLEAVVAARNQAVSSKSLDEEMSANGQLTQKLHHLFAVSESYPELKASENFMALQKELAETEDKIAKARQFYNDIILKYNNAIQMFPANVAAKIFGFKAFEYLEAGEEERERISISV